jgi:hypothetical protein
MISSSIQVISQGCTVRICIELGVVLQVGIDGTDALCKITQLMNQFFAEKSGIE